jgi:hypothetical protein
MYQPDPKNVYMCIPFDPRRGEYTFDIFPFYYFSDDFLLPNEGYVLWSDFAITYDITKIDDGTVNGDNDAQIIAINELLKYFAFQERNWYKIGVLIDAIFGFDFVSSTRQIIIPPPVALEDCTRKLFGVGTRYMPEWAQYNGNIVLCLKAYAAYYGSGGESPIGENGNIDEPAGGESPIDENGNIEDPSGGESPIDENGNIEDPSGGESPIDENGNIEDPSGGESPIGENGNIKEPKDVLGEFKFTSCEEWFDKQFTLAIGDWRSATISGWRKSRGFPLIDSWMDLYWDCR